MDTTVDKNALALRLQEALDALVALINDKFGEGQ